MDIIFEEFMEDLRKAKGDDGVVTGLCQSKKRPSKVRSYDFGVYPDHKPDAPTRTLVMHRH